MGKRHDKNTDGKYHINGKTYDLLEGSRAQVWHGTAYKTSGGLTKGNLKMKRGRIVSVTKSNLARTQKHLKGHLQPKGSGVFGTIKKKGKKSGTQKRKGSRRK
jgi:hypothetical protein